MVSVTDGEMDGQQLCQKGLRKKIIYMSIEILQNNKI